MPDDLLYRQRLSSRRCTGARIPDMEYWPMTEFAGTLQTTDYIVKERSLAKYVLRPAESQSMS